MFNEARSIVRGLLRHKARPPGRALWYLNIRPAVRPEKRASRYHDAVALLHGASEVRDHAITAETLVTQNARALKNFD